MSNAKAIATVTTALAQLARTAVRSEIDTADVVTSRPEPNGTPVHRAHLFLYHVRPNATFRNAILPRPDTQERLVKRSGIALDLDYLFAFYGDENILEPQRMMGAVIRDLYAHPILTDPMINDAIDSQPFLSGSDLANTPEKIKITFVSSSAEEISSLWSKFFQTSYALTLLVQATVVIIES